MQCPDLPCSWRVRIPIDVSVRICLFPVYAGDEISICFALNFDIEKRDTTIGLRLVGEFDVLMESVQSIQDSVQITFSNICINAYLLCRCSTTVASPLFSAWS